jgi:hypothetical protein
MSLYPPVLVARLALFYQVPGFLLLDFKRPEIHIYLYQVLAFEIFWNSPRVPADAASAILELAGCKYCSGFIYNLQCRRFESTAVLPYLRIVTFVRLSGDRKAYRYLPAP